MFTEALTAFAEKAEKTFLRYQERGLLSWYKASRFMYNNPNRPKSRKYPGNAPEMFAHDGLGKLADLQKMKAA